MKKGLFFGICYLFSLLLFSIPSDNWERQRSDQANQTLASATINAMVKAETKRQTNHSYQSSTTFKRFKTLNSLE
jgi:hypothetical protein